MDNIINIAYYIFKIGFGLYCLVMGLKWGYDVCVHIKNREGDWQSFVFHVAITILALFFVWYFLAPIGKDAFALMNNQ